MEFYRLSLSYIAKGQRFVSTLILKLALQEAKLHELKPSVSVEENCALKHWFDKIMIIFLYWACRPNLQIQSENRIRNWCDAQANAVLHGYIATTASSFRKQKNLIH